MYRAFNLVTGEVLTHRDLAWLREAIEFSVILNNDSIENWIIERGHKSLF